MFITANGLMIYPFDGRITIDVLAAMLNYLEMFGLDGATFQIGDVKQYLTREDILG